MPVQNPDNTHSLKKDDDIRQLRLLLASKVNDGRQLFDLGQAYAARKDFKSAVIFLCQAVAAEEKNPRYYLALGHAMHGNGRYFEAVCACRQALALDDSSAAAYSTLGRAQGSLGEHDLAIAAHQMAVRKAPLVAEYWIHLAAVFCKGHHYSEAYKAAVKAHDLDKQSMDAHVYIATALFGLGRINSGTAWIRKGMRQQPGWTWGTQCISVGLGAQNRDEAAMRYARRYVRLEPSDAYGRFRLAQCLLMAGNFKEGWEEYEWRFKLPIVRGSAAGNFIDELTEPMWAGEDLTGKTLLVYGEQGFGDTFQAIRFVAEVTARWSCKIILMVYRDLVSLLKPMPSVSHVIAYGDLIPRYDYHIPVFSLPRLLKTTIHNIPCNVPYIPIPRRAKIPAMIRRPAKFRVGIFWASNRLTNLDHRSLSLSSLEPVLKCRSVDFFSFQIKYSAGELGAYRSHANIHDLKPFIKDWEDTACFLPRMDLMLTTDSGIAHLAGALGVPVWILMQRASEWRWLSGKRSSPWFDKSAWYPTMRLFRSQSYKSWDVVVEQVKDELIKLAGNRHSVSKTYSGAPRQFSRRNANNDFVNGGTLAGAIASHQDRCQPAGAHRRDGL